MSNYPVGGMPMPEYALPVVPARPKVVTVVAIIGIVMAVLTLLCNVYTAGAAIVQLSGIIPPAQSSPRWITQVGIALSMIGFIIALLWLILSIGLLRLANWARHWGVLLGVAHLIVIVAMTIVQLTLTASGLTDALYEQMASRAATDPNAPHLTHGIVSAMVIGGTLFSSFIGMILPTLMLVTLTRPTVVKAFVGNQNAGGYQPMGLK